MASVVAFVQQWSRNPPSAHCSAHGVCLKRNSGLRGFAANPPYKQTSRPQQNLPHRLAIGERLERIGDALKRIDFVNMRAELSLRAPFHQRLHVVAVGMRL